MFKRTKQLQAEIDSLKAQPRIIAAVTTGRELTLTIAVADRIEKMTVMTTWDTDYAAIKGLMK